MQDVEQKFIELIKTTELRKVDFKRDQYRIDNKFFKSEFIKDILCMANAPGNEGFILLGVESIRGKPSEVTGIFNHHDSSVLEEIVNGVIQDPIQFEYYQIKYEDKDCALIHVPLSKAKPHRPKKDYGVLKEHVIYTRRASGNRQASIQEIRDMCIESIRVSDIAPRKARSSQHIVDELANYSIKEREKYMYKMLRSIAPKIGLLQYRFIFHVSSSEPTGVLLTSSSSKGIQHLAIIMYPWTAKSDYIRAIRYDIYNIAENAGASKHRPNTRARLLDSSLVHISYKTIYTKALEKNIFRLYPRTIRDYRFANERKESWGKIMQWEDYLNEGRKPKYEYFLDNVSSEAELMERLEKLLSCTTITLYMTS